MSVLCTNHAVNLETLKKLGKLLQEIAVQVTFLILFSQYSTKKFQYFECLLIVIISSLLFLFIFKLVGNCYCKNKNGEPGNNGFLCEIEGKVEEMGSCTSDEWCTGPTVIDAEQHLRIRDIKNLCSKGIFYGILKKSGFLASN